MTTLHYRTAWAEPLRKLCVQAVWNVWIQWAARCRGTRQEPGEADQPRGSFFYRPAAALLVVQCTCFFLGQQPPFMLYPYFRIRSFSIVQTFSRDQPFLLPFLPFPVSLPSAKTCCVSTSLLSSLSICLFYRTQPLYLSSFQANSISTSRFCRPEASTPLFCKDE